jgi:diguanylate cyclase (GGDEF)-like protein
MKSHTLRILFLLLLACVPLFFPLIKHFLPPYNKVSTAYEIFFLTPFLLFTLVAFLGMRLNQTRIFYSMIMMTLIYVSLHRLTAGYIEPLNYILFLYTLFILSILYFLYLFIFNEGALFGLLSFLRAAGIACVFVFTYLIVDSELFFLHKILHGQWLIVFSGWKIADISWVFLIGTSIFLLMDNEKAIYPFKIALVLSFITLILVFNRTIAENGYSIDLKMYNAVAFNVIGMICLYSVYKLYWQNVYIDELTGIPNRRAFNEQLKKLGRKYTIAMLDIDHFKKFNDMYGHTEGDNVLRYVAAHLRETSHAKIFRYGGEEFAAVYPGQKLNDVQWRLEQMRESLANRHFAIRMNETKRSQRSEKDRGRNMNGSKKVKVTISVGISQRNEKFKTPENVIEAADKALYMAKKKGRNQCSVKRG